MVIEIHILTGSAWDFPELHISPNLDFAIF